MSVSGAPKSEAYPSPLKAWLTSIVLFGALALAFMDRQVINLLVDPIKADFHLTDVQMSYLTGIAFAGLFSVAIMPSGWLADRLNRRNLVLGAAVLWSVATIFCGLTGGFWQFFAARSAVGLCEAVISPAAIPMIADMFPPARRAAAVSLYNVGSGVGVSFSLIFGGLILAKVTDWNVTSLPVVGPVLPWQVVYVVLGIGGGIVICAALLGIREPKRNAGISEAAEPSEIVRFVLLSLFLSGAVVSGLLHIWWLIFILVPLGLYVASTLFTGQNRSEAFAFIAQHRTVFIPHFLGLALAGICVFAMLSWLPAHIGRTFGWAPSDIGWRYGLMFFLGPLGAVGAGFLAERIIQRGRIDGTLIVTAIGIAGFAVFGIVAVLATSVAVAIPAIVLMLIFISVPYGPGVAVLTQVAPPKIRSRVLSVYLFVFNTSSLIFGPLVPALFTDYVYHSPKLVGYSIATTLAILEPIAFVLILLAMRPFRPVAQEVSRIETAAHAAAQANG
jgi:MFS family permease